MIEPIFEPDVIGQIRASLDLRQPNVEALETIAIDTARYFADGSTDTFEGVIEVATGVGKTYVAAAVVEYFAAQDRRNFAIVTPGRTVTRKTIANFTAGHARSLLGGMEVTPHIITSDNFDNPGVAEALDDPNVVKLYIFTVQALLTPTTKADRRTHEFRESLGAGLYARLRDADDLVILADEYHLYSGKKFRAAIEGLQPQMLLGLTATAPKGSPVIYRYPLAAAIADGYVKSPVLVGRPDDRADAYTKLNDGLRLLDRKAIAYANYQADHPEAGVVNPLMLVIAPDTTAADDVETLLKRPDLAAGRYAGSVLTVHSNVKDPDEALALLDGVEDPGSKVRVIVSVGMLREGWDVKSVAVLCSLRASVSEILTEQTLGRGLRLPYGQRTGDEVLDTLEVVAHERYQDLIARVEKMKTEMLDYRTTLAATYEGTPDPETAEAGVSVTGSDDGAATLGGVTITGVDERIEHSDEVMGGVGEQLQPREIEPPLLLPIVTVAAVEAPWSINSITDTEPFRQDGRLIAADPENRLLRTVVTGKVTTDTATGRRIASMGRRAAVHEVASEGLVLPLADARQQLVEAIIQGGAVASRPAELRRLAEIVDVFIEGLGDHAAEALSAFGGRAAAAVSSRIRVAQREVKPALAFHDDIKLRPFASLRFGRTNAHDAGEAFVRGDGYRGFTKSLYTEDWFDSESAEFALARLFDRAPQVTWWLRLQRGDLPLPWQGGGYNPDFIVRDDAGAFWVIEGKSDRDIANEDVVAKRKAANQWANHVRTHMGVPWHYMFVSERDIKTAKESWPALKRLSGAV